MLVAFGNSFRRRLQCNSMSGIQRTSPNSAQTVREFPAPPSRLLDTVGRAIEKLPRWRVQSRTETEIKATRTTRLLRFVDDVAIDVEARGDGSRARISSASRVGKGDLGQNVRNIQELLEALEKELPAGS